MKDTPVMKTLRDQIEEVLGSDKEHEPKISSQGLGTCKKCGNVITNNGWPPCEDKRINDILSAIRESMDEVIGEDDRISDEMALDAHGKDFMLIELNKNRLRSKQRNKLEEVLK